MTMIRETTTTTNYEYDQMGTLVRTVVVVTEEETPAAAARASSPRPSSGPDAPPARVPARRG